jgi:hypothetical protein
MELPPEKRKNFARHINAGDEKDDGEGSDADGKDEKDKNPDLDAVKS